MMKRESDIVDIDVMMDERFGTVGSAERSEFRKEAYTYCVGQLICDARKRERMTQSDLAERIGASKSYVSRVEKGQIEPGVGTFFRILEALGLRFEIVRPLAYSFGSDPSPRYLSDPESPIYSKKNNLVKP